MLVEMILWGDFLFSCHANHAGLLASARYLECTIDTLHHPQSKKRKSSATCFVVIVLVKQVVQKLAQGHA